MPTLTRDDGYDAMDRQARQIVDQVITGNVVVAETLMTELIRTGELSGQDQQSCEEAIAKARAR